MFPSPEKPHLLAFNILACPSCKQGLRQDGFTFVCPACGKGFPRYGQLDFRLTGKDKVILELVIDHSDTGSIDDPGYVIPFPFNPSPEVDYRGMKIPRHLKASLLSHVPRAKEKGAFMLDLGCGAAIHREVCEHAGFTYLGLDIRHPRASFLGDAHFLPFVDNSFEFILSVATLEHLQYPLLALKEAWRVLKPGGRLIGTVAFLEPFHDYSYYHHSHLGLQSALKQGGFKIKVFGPNADWLALRALAEMTLFPKMPKALTRALVKPVELLHRLWWRLGDNLFGFSGAKKSLRLQATAGSFSFVVEKPQEVLV